jgi:hypothetical protein
VKTRKEQIRKIETEAKIKINRGIKMKDNKENKKSKLKPLEDCINFEPEYLKKDIDYSLKFYKSVSDIKQFCDSQGIKRGNLKINDELIKKISHKMNDIKVDEASRLKLSAVKSKLLDFSESNDKTINLDLD